MEYTKVKYAVDTEKRVAIVSLDSPSNLNAFNGTLIDELVDACGKCEADPNVKAVILNSTGRAFSAGGDIGAMYKGIKTNTLNFSEDIRKMAEVSIAIKKLTKPVIASCNGAVAGAGFNLALACDYIIADENAMFMQAFVNIGLIPDAGGFYLLTRAVGVNKAMELALTGRPVKAEEAKALGFVAKVVKAEDLAAETMKIAAGFAKGPSASYKFMKSLVWESDFKGLEEFVKAEVEAQTTCGDTEDFKEGVCAFVEKRTPKFQ